MALDLVALPSQHHGDDVDHALLVVENGDASVHAARPSAPAIGRCSRKQAPDPPGPAPRPG